MMKRITALAAVALLAVVAQAQAADQVVEQKNKKFAPETLVVKKGQTVAFKNADPFTHNVYSDTAGMEFEIRTQAPGEQAEIKFDKAGDATVKCAVHPTMKMSVKVE